MGCAAVAGVHLFALAKLNDALAIATVCLGIWALRVRHANCHGQPGTTHTFLSAILLLLDERSSPFSVSAFGRKLRAAPKRFLNPKSFGSVLLCAVIFSSGLLRLIPVWNHAAPFSVEYYDTLNKVRLLQLNQLYSGESRIPLGLPIIAQLLSLAAQVNPPVVLHFLGAVFAMMLAGAVAFVIYRSSGSLENSAIGAAIFGVFNLMLPMDLRSQVEADGLLLAFAFILPALAFFADFLAQPGRRTLLVALAGLVTGAAVNLFAGFVAMVAVSVMLVTALLLSFRLTWMRGRNLGLMLLMTLLIPASCALFVYIGLSRESVRNVLQILLYDMHLNRYTAADLHPSQTLTLAGGIVFSLTIFLSLKKRPSPSRNILQLFCGAFGWMALLFVVRSGDSWLTFVPMTQMLLVFSLVFSLAAGIIAGEMTEWLAGLLGRASEFLGTASRIAWAVAVLWAIQRYSPPVSIDFQFTAEPDGFATSLYKIEQEFMPYQWTVVSHRGTLLSGMNRGRFLDYEYFCDQYDPRAYRAGKPGSIPTPLVFVFVERATDRTDVETELATTDRNASTNIKAWVEEYRKTHSDLRVFYSDEAVVVYEIEDRAANALRG